MINERKKEEGAGREGISRRGKEGMIKEAGERRGEEGGGDYKCTCMPLTASGFQEAIVIQR